MRARAAGGIAALLTLAVLLAFTDAYTAVADATPAPCPTAPAAYTGTDPVVAALVQENIDADRSCTALADRLDAIDSDLTAAGVAAHADAGTAQRALDAIDGTVAGWTTLAPLPVTLPGGGGGSAVTVTNWPPDQTVALDGTSASVIDGEAQSNHGDLWVLIGVVVGTFAAGQVLRKVWP